jgi:acetolactate synthase-1/2/3 large subunit
VRHADEAMEWLRELGYTHCFFVAGGNIMHLLNGARSRFACIPTVHEVAAGIAVEYFNALEGRGRAFALVTAGPGVTNVITALAGAFLESRELLVLAGQVKSSDLARGLRQRGIQEVDGVALARPVSVRAERIERPIARADFVAAVESGRTGRRGPVFLEFCLDAQGAPAGSAPAKPRPAAAARAAACEDAELRVAARAAAGDVVRLLAAARRPILLLGGGVTRETAAAVLPDLRRIGIPVQTTWNGIDRIGADETVYAGRPNTWGQRFANVLIQQADVVVALGTRLGLQQTGFNWQQFVPAGRVVQVDIDAAELAKGHPRVDMAVRADANALLRELVRGDYPDYSEWRAFCAHVRERLPLDEPANVVRPGYVNPYAFYAALSRLARRDDAIVPCSSGGANSTAFQSLEQKAGQLILADKGLASMGYGLAGAIGAAYGRPEKRVLLIEGDGGFAQNSQELATVAVGALNVKTFVFANEGYASIRTTQKNYFGGAYVGCDVRTGLGFPDWEKLFGAYGISAMTLAPDFERDPRFLREFACAGPRGFVVPVDPEQTYHPKIASRVTATGAMESNPLHLMTPELEPGIADDVLRYLRAVPAAAP